MQDHIRILTEIFDELAVIGSPVEEEDRVVHLLASLPESYGVLVTALEASSRSEVPKMEVVTERLLHEEQKQKEKDSQESSSMALYASRLKKGMVKCYHCGKLGHLKRNCRLHLILCKLIYKCLHNTPCRFNIIHSQTRQLTCKYTYGHMHYVVTIATVIASYPAILL